MEELCAACLCADRKMVCAKDTGVFYVYKEILNEILIPKDILEITKICWECEALLRRYKQFRQQVIECHTELLNCLHQDPLAKCSSRQSHIQTHKLFDISCSLAPQHVKTEMKEEEDGVHCEPETFADDLVEVKLPKKIKKKSKKPHRSKRKRKRVTDDVINDGLSDKDDVVNGVASDRDDVVSNGGGVATVTEQESGDVKREVRADEELQAAGDAVPETKVAKRERSREVLPEKPQCVECGKMFSSRKTYRYHINVLHKGQNRHPCPRCGKVYHWKSNLGRHMRSHQAVEDGELYCGPCDKSFASIATYRQHLKLSKQHVSEDDFSFSCDHCGKKFVNKTRLRDHIDWEHLRKIKFRCELCDKPFKCHTSLYVHRQSVHGARDVRDNLCHVCGKSYHNAAKLKYHIVAMHTSETPFRCAHCSASFGWYSSLYRHVRLLHYKLPGKVKKGRKTKPVEEEQPDVPTGAAYT
ncbi:unnamed protein product [Leptidea sinapis]|uniref:C2H2-type domain-containing protein n=1 Tax=Leptidea sinapis TaxID=189913 RepID=A0A5E4Q7G8_9NEOP|nr:unnamed protein product [Leptidea sinapis]